MVDRILGTEYSAKNIRSGPNIRLVEYSIFATKYSEKLKIISSKVYMLDIVFNKK